jgi:hypothetical protein
MQGDPQSGERGVQLTGISPDRLAARQRARQRRVQNTVLGVELTLWGSNIRLAG